MNQDPIEILEYQLTVTTCSGNEAAPILQPPTKDDRDDLVTGAWEIHTIMPARYTAKGVEVAIVWRRTVFATPSEVIDQLGLAPTAEVQPATRRVFPEAD